MFFLAHLLFFIIHIIIANENDKMMKKGVLVAVVLVGMLSGCSLKTCPTYMYHPDQKKDMKVRAAQPAESIISDADKNS